jgi:hypothetical protein
MRRFAPLLLTAVVLIGAVACSDDGEDADTSDSTDAPTETTAAPDDTTTTTGDDTDSTEVPAEGEASDTDYADPAHWLCRPDLASNPCLEGLDVTVLQEDGSTEVQPFVPAEDAAVDCFYLYPTVNLGTEGNAPFDGEYGIELGTTLTQAGRFGEFCDVYAPVYRQVTLGSFGEGDEAEAQARSAIATGDVRAAFEHYLAEDNDGRPFILMGHSQGSGMAAMLMSEYVDDDPALLGQMVSAFLIGSAVAVPEGEDVGGDFDNIPACRTEAQTGCIVSYATFRSTSPPPDNSFFGRPREADGVALCTNPAALGGGVADLQPIYPSAGDGWGVEITTPYVALPGLMQGECVSENGFDYLKVTLLPGDGPRADDVSGDLTPEWGLHAVDYNLMERDLVELGRAQAEAYLGEE